MPFRRRMKRGLDKVVDFLTPSRSSSAAPSHRDVQRSQPANIRTNDFNASSPSVSAPEGCITDVTSAVGLTGDPSSAAFDGQPEGITKTRPTGDGSPESARSHGPLQSENVTPPGHDGALKNGSTNPSQPIGHTSQPADEGAPGLSEIVDDKTTDINPHQIHDSTTPEAAPAETASDISEKPLIVTTAAPNEEHQRPKDNTASTWYTTFKTTLDLVVQVSDVFPPLKSAAAAVKALLDVHDAFSDNREEFEKLSERVTFLEKILSGRPDLPPDIRGRRDGLARAVDELSKQLEEKTSQTKLKGVVFAKDDQREILRIIREINFAIEFAMLDVSVSNETLILRAVNGIDWVREHSITELQKVQEGLSNIARGVANLSKAEQLKKLGDVKDYSYFNKNQRGECVPGSRVALLAQLLAWAEDPTSAHAFWLSGMAGTGKTAVSETFCAQLSNRGLLGASFFCSIKNRDLNDVYHIIPTLAKALAARYPEFGGALSSILESSTKDPIREMKLSEQYDVLIIRPAEQAFGNRKTYVLLCVDALDECNGAAALKDFLTTILSQILLYWMCLDSTFPPSIRCTHPPLIIPPIHNCSGLRISNSPCFALE